MEAGAALDQLRGRGTQDLAQAEAALDTEQALPASTLVRAARTIEALGVEYIEESKHRGKAPRTIQSRESRLNAHVLPPSVTYLSRSGGSSTAATGFEGLSGRPGYLDGPVTIRCEYEQVPDIAVTGPLPLIGGLLLIVLVLGVVAVTIQWAQRDPQASCRTGPLPTSGSAAEGAQSCRCAD